MSTKDLEAVLTEVDATIRERMMGRRVLHVVLTIDEDGLAVIRSNAGPDQLETIAEGLKNIAEQARLAATLIRPLPSPFIEPLNRSSRRSRPLAPTGCMRSSGTATACRRTWPAAKATIFTRRGHDWTRQFRPLADATARLSAKSTIIDGEALALSEAGVALLPRPARRARRPVATAAVSGVRTGGTRWRGSAGRLGR
jgi:hypothetical protein